MENEYDVIITLASKVVGYSYDQLDIEYSSDEDEVIGALAPIIEEQEGVDIRSGFTVKYLETDEQISVFPKSTAGF